MRNCRYLNSLRFDCCDWSACVASDSWGKLDVPPPEVVARGTQGVFEFSHATLCREIRVNEKVFPFDWKAIDLKSCCLGANQLEPLFWGFSSGKFLTLHTLNLVIFLLSSQILFLFNFRLRMEIKSEI